MVVIIVAERALTAQREIMATIWLTYAWADNKDSDVDFVAQELTNAGLTVKLDRWNLQAGKPLWQQIEDHIVNPQQSDGWVLYATQNSLGSEACKEEYRIALDRALHSRGPDYPVIALFPSTVDRDLIPPGIRVRLYVMIADPDWKERILAAVAGRELSLQQRHVQPYGLHIRKMQRQKRSVYVIEVRPRAGTWAPFFAAVPLKEKDLVKPRIARGPRDHPPQVSALHMTATGPSENGAWWIESAGDEASPTQSYFVFCDELPSTLVFGVPNGSPQYQHVFGARRLKDSEGSWQLPEEIAEAISRGE
jgi:hypothetical protein